MEKLPLRKTVPILLIIVVAALFHLLANRSDQTVDHTQQVPSITDPPAHQDPRNEVVDTYISLMQKEHYSRMRELWPSANTGAIELDPDAKAISPDRIPQTSKEDFDITLSYKYQHDSVISLFGKEAWQSMEYGFTKISAPDGKAKWIEKSTGKEITFEESVKLNEQYWENVFSENNWTEKDVFTPEGVEETPEEAAQREKNYAKYIDGEPVEYVIEEHYERYVVQFSFGGKEVAETGEHQFKLTIVNPDGKWTIYDMLIWNPPITEPTSEV